METFMEWLDYKAQVKKGFKDIKEARNWLRMVSKGHGIVDCTCGDRIESCRCMAKDHHIAVVENGCEKCGGDPHPEMRKMDELLKQLKGSHEL